MSEDSNRPGRRASPVPPGTSGGPLSAVVARYWTYCRLRAAGCAKKFAWELACAFHPRKRGDVSGP